MNALDSAMQWIAAQRTAISTVLIPFLFTSVLGSVVGTFLTVRVKDWLKRPRIRVALSGVDMRYENVFNEGYWETSIAEIHERAGTSERVSNLRPFLDKYLEIEMTLSNVPHLSVSKVVVHTKRGKAVDITAALLAPVEHRFDKVLAPLLDEHITRKFYAKQSLVPDGPSNIASISIQDGMGATHHSSAVKDTAALKPSLDPSLFDWLPQKDYTLKQAPSRLGFGVNLGNIGPHIGCVLAPESGSPCQNAIDDEEAEKLATFVRNLPDCERFQALTVREGVILSDIHPLDEQGFYRASRAIHVVDNGSVTALFLQAPSTLQSIAKCLLVAFAVARYLSVTRFTVNRQHITVGYWVGEGHSGLLQPPGDTKYASIDITCGFADQCADVVVDLLRANPNTPAKRREIAAVFADYWQSIFTSGIEALLP